MNVVTSKVHHISWPSIWHTNQKEQLFAHMQSVSFFFAFVFILFFFDKISIKINELL